MRIILLALLCFPLLVIGQASTAFGLLKTVDNTNESPVLDLIATNDMTLVAVEFGIKKETSSVKVHPNPSSRDLYVTLTGRGTTGKVVVYDILANVIVESEDFQLAGGSNMWSHNVSDWRTGTYVVRVLQDDTVVKSLRFIKN
jgi:Secretion system C-terminal sorting domain